MLRNVNCTDASLGIVPAAGATQRLPRIIGLGRVKQMILTGPLAVRLAIGTLAQAICFESEDKTEGVTAFLSKRSPKFRR